jgi:undecaprenyl-diphosphatase
MIDFLYQIDKSIVLTINGCHLPWLDELMWFISSKLFWIFPFFIILSLTYFKLDLKHWLLFIFSSILLFVLTDQICLHLFKDLVLRERPSYNAEISSQLHLYYNAEIGELYKGKQFASFVSSHAANYFSLVAFYSWVIDRKWTWDILTLIIIGLVVGLSRIYLGVHYLSDIIGGATIGIMLAWLFKRYIYDFFVKKIN